MLAYQEGMRFLHKIRSGGRQVVIVQHVQVWEGGQAVIAGEVQNRLGGTVEEGQWEKIRINLKGTDQFGHPMAG